MASTASAFREARGGLARDREDVFAAELRHVVDARSCAEVTAPSVRSVRIAARVLSPPEEILRGDLVPVGHLPTPAGRLLVFPNSHVHKVSDVRAVGDNGKRRIVVFWLVDPDWRLVSTKEVPPQQGVMSRTDAKQHRLALMRHRRFHKQSRNVRVIELCEH